MTADDNEGREPVLAVRNLRKHFPVRQSLVEQALTRLRGRRPPTAPAVDGVSFDLFPAETLGLVGESGCGKTTLGWSILRLMEPTDGQVVFQGRNLAHLKASELRSLRRRMQVVFQDPAGSLNPRRTAGQAVSRALAVAGATFRADRRERIGELFRVVGLEPDLAGRYPHQLSGGQKQRVSIGRALATDPDLLVADEPVSSLDVSVQAQILSLIVELQRERGLALLFISHDLSVVRQVSDRIAVMYAGRLVEVGSASVIIDSPCHPYTQSLIDAVPRLHQRHHLLARDPLQAAPGAIGPQAGCPFQPRCAAQQTDACRQVVPELAEVAAGHSVACHLVPATGCS